MRCAGCGRAIDDRSVYCVVCGRRSRHRRYLASGTIVGERYRIDGKLAEGGFGVVYRATHVADSTRVALKVLHADLVSDHQALTRFRQESIALSRLRGPHVVETFERGEFADGTPYIAMELLFGATLLEHLRARGALPWREVLTVIHGACSSLADAHDQGIVHRDLKPSNVHVAHGGQVKVLDFGVAKLASSTREPEQRITAAGQFIGTLDYMAPEQLAMTACSSRSDIYALGVIAYEMVCGHRPFPDARTAPSLMAALLTRTPAIPSDVVPVPEAVDQLIMRCLECDPDRRFQTVSELGRAIELALVPPPSRLRIAITYVLGAAIASTGALGTWTALR